MTPAAAGRRRGSRGAAPRKVLATEKFVAAARRILLSGTRKRFWSAGKKRTKKSKIQTEKGTQMTFKEKITMNDTMSDVMAYLRKRIGTGSEYVPYGEIAKEVKKSRHAVAYAIERLRRQRTLGVDEGKLYIMES